MEVLELARGLELRATSFVGRFSLGEVTVTVRPKISGAPLLNLFRYAYGLRHLDLYGSVEFASSPWSFQDLLIQQLAAEVGELLTRGIHRDYERTCADLASPRGRIDFSRYVRTAHSGRTTLPCIHHPRTEDTVLNRVLLAGLGLAANLATDVELKAHVRRLGKMLASSVATIAIDPNTVTQAWRGMDRRTTAYKPALTLIELLLGDQGIALDERSAHVRLSGFLFDMNRFFQALVSRFLREHLSGVDVHDEFRLKGVFSYEPVQNPRARRAPTLRPDFVVMRGGKMVAVLDAKYRDLWESSLPREMLYQLALYALGRPGIERTSAILYPTIATAREQVIAIKEPIHGTAQARVALRPVNLLALDELLRGGSSVKMRERCRVFAHWLAFGGQTGQL
jgi:5-methylcytosine-specific restriction enzyme subunit McrC